VAAAAVLQTLARHQVAAVQVAVVQPHQLEWLEQQILAVAAVQVLAAAAAATAVLELLY
jgi:hypothetical protein